MAQHRLIARSLAQPAARVAARSPRRAHLRAFFAMSAVGLFATAALAAPVRAQEAPGASQPKRVSLASVMTGEGGGVAATATSDFMQETATVRVTVHNSTPSPVEVEIPYGSLFAPEQESQQTVVTAGPNTVEAAVARTTGTPTLTAPPGDSSHELMAFCGEEFDRSPRAAVPVSYRGVAKEPLPKVMHNIFASDTDARTAQEAVWWVTDRPMLPITDTGVERLLDGVDTAGFAAAPTKVVPSESYTPQWAGGNGAVLGPRGVDGAAGSVPVGLITVVLACTIGLVLLVLFFVRRKPVMGHAVARSSSGPIGQVGQHGPFGSPTSGSARPPGWYADPWSRGLRFWDGANWTDARSSEPGGM